MEHGGRTDAAKTHYRAAPQPWLDLSTGINPVAWAGFRAIDADLCALPLDSDLLDLEERASLYFGSTVSIAAVPGSETALGLLGVLGLPTPYRHVSPCYCSNALLPGSIAIESSSLLGESERGGTILLANPNNPDGRIIPPDRILAIAGMLEANGGWLVIDEAFADALPESSVLPWLADIENVIVMRSFGKFFGLAGVRLGFVAGPDAILARYRSLLGAWPISATAIAAGRAAYADHRWASETVAALAERARALDAMLSRHGYRPTGDCPLFRLIDAGDAAALFDRLARQGILTRPFSYAPHWLRFGVPAHRADLDRLDRALALG